jgi:predicted DNA-binding protein (UPF0251 family)
MHRRRRGRRGRHPIQPRIRKDPVAKQMNPLPMGRNEPIYLDSAEVEVLRLVDFDGLYQEEAGLAMGFSRGTVWRLLESARSKVIGAILEGRPLLIGHEEEDAPSHP